MIFSSHQIRLKKSFYCFGTQMILLEFYCEKVYSPLNDYLQQMDLTKFTNPKVRNYVKEYQDYIEFLCKFNRSTGLVLTRLYDSLTRSLDYHKFLYPRTFSEHRNILTYPTIKKPEFKKKYQEQEFYRTFVEANFIYLAFDRNRSE